MIKNDIIFTERHNIVVFNEYIECIFIELQRNITGLSKNVLIGLVYRSPNSNIDQFNDTISELLIQVKNEKKLCWEALI